MPFIEFIKRKRKEIISPSANAVKTLNKGWNGFLEKDVYLIHDDKSDFLDIIKNVNKEIKIPWYLFWDISSKNKHKSNLQQLEQYKEEIKEYNKNFVIKKKKKYKSLFKKGINLDDRQKTAIITDDKHNLVIAGAGSGKTEVLITRISYLIKRKSDPIRSQRILALTFQKKASEEIKERVEKRLKEKRKKSYDVEIKTFHSLGKAIINDLSKQKKNKKPELKPECSEENLYRKYIEQLFKKEISTNNELKNDITNLMKTYYDEEIAQKEISFKKKEEFYKYQRNLKYSSLNGQKVKSEAEKDILNFFLMHKLNDERIKIRYEHPAEWGKYKNEKGEEMTIKPDFYFPDFDVYLEHWAIDENGKVPEWFKGENPTKKYTESMNLKKKKYETHQKLLIETSHADYKKGNFQNLLYDKFISILKSKEPDKTYNLEKLSYKELVDSSWDSAKFVKQIHANISKFIHIAKTYRLYPKDIEKRLDSEIWLPKQQSFAKIANQIYKIYQQELKKENYIDFSDMINDAVDCLKKNKKFYKDKYDHILIDEYQDISTQRYEIIKELMKKNNKCKLFCVGDDWQSIMGFAGSNIDFFINFCKRFPNPEKTYLTKNYRSIKSIVDAGACIIKNNKERQIKKKTISDRNESKPILVFSSKYPKEFFRKYYDQIARHCLDKIKEYHDKKYPYDDFMILVRIKNPLLINSIYTHAESSEIPISEQPRPNCVQLTTVHKSKGLQAKVVIILDVIRDLYGFPCELEDSDIFLPAIKTNDELSKEEERRLFLRDTAQAPDVRGLSKEEERRLFYVAVTRAKEDVMIYTQESRESEFIKEIEGFIKRQYLSVP